MVIKTERASELAKRMFFLAYKASNVVGMGVLQARDGVTEADVWKSAITSWDGRDNSSKPYGDYIFGRMMKMSLSVGNGAVEFRDTKLNREYQSWCGVYSTYLALAQAAAAELGIQIQSAETAAA